MSAKHFASVVLFSVTTVLAARSASAQISISTVTIGNPGNAPDPRVIGDGTSNYGSVASVFRIGTYEVTNEQYAAFLNAKAASDAFGLYNVAMAGALGGITRSGPDGAYTYSAISGRENHPVNFVSFWDACRFANWLHNGQSNGDTETGAYTLTPQDIAANTVTRNADWLWAVTSEDEWYKAAYHQPAGAGGDPGDYWLYPTSSNSINNAQANYGFFILNTTPVGFYDPNFYGTFDMGGNVLEWNEATPQPFTRGNRGGSLFGIELTLRCDARSSALPSAEGDSIGFRVSRAVPPAPDNVIIDNITEPVRGISILGTIAPDNIWAAQGFTVPSAYDLESITLLLGQSVPGNDPVAELRQGELPDGPAIANLLLPPLNPLLVEPTLLTPDVPVTLQAGEKYWIVLGTSTTESLGWAYAFGNNWTGPGSLIEYRYSEDQGVSWLPAGSDNPYLVLIIGTAVVPCPADFTADGFVDDSDFVIFAAAYEAFTVPPADAAADLTGDGFVDDSDFVLFAAAYEAFTCP